MRSDTGATPAQPPRNYLSGLSNGNGGLSKQTFGVVGYGVFLDNPTEGPQKPTSVADRTRRFTTAVGQNISSEVLKLAESAKDSRAGGGTCFGDSGGPVFHNGLLVGDTSFGASQFCRSAGGYYRLDTDDARSLLDDFVPVPRRAAAAHAAVETPGVILPAARLRVAGAACVT